MSDVIVTIYGYWSSYTVAAIPLTIATDATIGSGGLTTGIANNYTVYNNGTIGAPPAATAVLIYRGGTVVNNLGASITGSAIGVSIGSGFEGANTHTSYGSITNSGTILGGTVAGLYLGDNLVQGAFVTNGNAGNITALISGADGILDMVGGFGSVAVTIDNFATIQGTGGVGSAGIKLSDGTFGTIVNGSTLDTAALITGYIGVDGSVAGAVTLQNYGTIQGTGGTAVLMGATFDTLIDEASGVFVGTVNGGGGTLRLAGDAGAGTLTALGTTFTNFNNVSVASGATWTLAGANTLASGVTLTDTGTLTVTGTLTSSGTLTDSGTLTNAGTLLMSAQALLVAPGGTLINTGSIGGDNSGGAGVSVAVGGSVTNQASGAITGYTGITAAGAAILTNAGTIGGNTSHGSGIRLQAAGSVTNQSGGTIGGFYGVYAVSGAATVMNAGSIAGSPLGGVGVDLRDGGLVTNQSGGTISGGESGVEVVAATGTVVNAGSIESTEVNAGYAVILNAGGSVTNQAGGVMDGSRGVEVVGAAGMVTNAGTIAGDPTPGQGIGVAFFNAAGTLTNQAGGTISGGLDAVRFAAGYDNLLVVDPGAVFIGTVTGNNIPGDIAVSVLELAAGSAAGTLTGLGSQFVDFVQSTIDSGASWTFAGSNTIGSGYTLTNDGTLTNTGTLTNAGTLFDNGVMLNSGAATLSGPLVVAGTLDNAGGVTVASYRGLQLSPGGYLYNEAGGYIGGTGAGTFFNPVVFAATGGDSTIRNLGTIDNATGDVAVYLAAGGTITNGSTSDTTALIYGALPIYVYRGRGTVTNFGTIEANPTVDGTGIALIQGGSVVNGASGSTAASILGRLYGVFAGDGPTTLTNFGTISGSYNGFGFYQRSGTATVTNAGVIRATNGSGIGVALQGGGTVVDSGTIAGAQTAVSFGGTGSNLLVLEHGYQLDGVVVGSASASNTLELQGSIGASVTADFNALGLSNFQTIAFAPGAGNYATLDIASNTVLPTTIAGFIAVHDRIDLTALSDAGNDATTSFNATTDVLTVTGDNGSVQLQLDNEDYTGIGFLASNDGSGGTLLTPVAESPPAIGGTVAGQAVTDAATDQPFALVTITDGLPASQAETITITLSKGGSATDADGTLSGAGLVRTGIGTYTLTSANAAAAQAALQALVFTPTAHQVALGSSVTTQFAITVTDAVGATASDSTTSVVATAVNDPPVITRTVGGQAAEDNDWIRPFTGVAVTDPDVGATETVTITLTAGGVATDANGTLLGQDFTKTGIGTYTLTTGSPAAVTAELEAVAFLPTAHEVSPGGTVATGFTLSVTDGLVGSAVVDTTTSVVTTALAIVPCFAAGTRLATPRGAVPVERLREGDILLTVSGKRRPIQWIGRRTVDCKRHSAPDRVKPICIAPHAFGENRPNRALRLSPDHAVFVDGVLIPVKHLVNGTTVTQLDVSKVTYYHIELPAHDVVLAEGLPAETYLETGGRSAFENGGGAMQLHPDFAPDEARVGMVWQCFGYAPFAGDGQLDRVRGQLACQARMLGYSTDSTSQSKKRVRRAVG